MTTDKDILKKLKKIEDEKLYSVSEIKEMRLILNTKLEPSEFTLYRIIKNGKIETTNLGTGEKSRSFIKGKDLKKFVMQRHNLVA